QKESARGEKGDPGEERQPLGQEVLFARRSRGSEGRRRLGAPQASRLDVRAAGVGPGLDRDDAAHAGEAIGRRRTEAHRRGSLLPEELFGTEGKQRAAGADQVSFAARSTASLWRIAPRW